jgi:lysozyme family protein
MTVSNFKPSLSLTLAYEGGYVNHPRDPGGATNRGITQAVYDDYRKYNGKPKHSVKYISNDEVVDIYNKQYWRLIRGDSLPCGLDYAVFDFAVNSGPSRAVRYLQSLVNTTVDGIIGFQTLTAVEAKARNDCEQLIVQYCANRLAFVRSLKTFDTFGKGWTRRIVGSQGGYQASDSGVIDHAVNMHRRSITHLKMVPPAIGSYEGEHNGKAGCENPDTQIVEAPKVTTTHDVKAWLPAINDQLANAIGR